MRETTWIFNRSAAQGRFELTDRDRLDLLHRMSTNNVNALKPGEGVSTVLTTALARIIDRVIVYNRGETALMIANRPSTVHEWLRKHIFFQDKVKIVNISPNTEQFEIHGSQADEIAEGIATGAAKLPLHHFLVAEASGHLIAKTYPLTDYSGYMVIGHLDNHSVPGIQEGDDAKYEQLRILAGMPAAGHELTEDYIPLEAGLWDSVSFSKGCYIGQEIIARMESRNKLAKTLVALRLDQSAEMGSAVQSGDETIGTVTSITPLDDGMYAALAFVKPAFAAPETIISINAAPARVAPAPLIYTRTGI